MKVVWYTDAVIIIILLINYYDLGLTITHQYVEQLFYTLIPDEV